MEEQNLGLTLHGDTLDDLAAFLTEYAQIQRVVRNHDKANRAEVIRNTIYSQHADKL